jgi:hypothetical protein
MKRFLLTCLILLVATFSAFAQGKPWSKYAFTISGGLGLLTSFDGGTTYSDRWNYKYLEYVQENTTITTKVENSIFFTADFSYFFSPNFGIQIGGGYVSPKVTPDGTFTFSYKWTTGSSVYNESAADSNIPWTGTAKASAIPLYLNIVGRYSTGKLDIFGTAGPTLFFNSYEATSFVGFGDTSYYSIIIWPYLYEFQYVDAFKIPARIPKTTWTGFGVNIGAGLDYWISPTVAVTLQARYFINPEKSLAWEWTPGTYNSIFYNNFTGWQYTADDFKDYEAKMGASKANLSFFAIAIGFIFGFGPM